MRTRVVEPMINCFSSSMPAVHAVHDVRGPASTFSLARLLYIIPANEGFFDSSRPCTWSWSAPCVAHSKRCLFFIDESKGLSYILCSYCDTGVLAAQRSGEAQRKRSSGAATLSHPESMRIGGGRIVAGTSRNETPRELVDSAAFALSQYVVLDEPDQDGDSDDSRLRFAHFPGLTCNYDIPRSTPVLLTLGPGVIKLSANSL
ncbi:hypothetical protein B0H16DRAFT_1882410 [Mycena metata]|uniref:Uncharacterized protein n=1 Tax=Mycena metata TaxID=1033252 RepID=A0AAD7JME7_9AGAR|nr:hypothetical protein B0H16DRAFT_1882410 [Mycena metata]